MVTAKKNIIDIMRDEEVVPMAYDVLADTRLPVNVRAAIALGGYKKAVNMAKELGALK